MFLDGVELTWIFASFIEEDACAVVVGYDAWKNGEFFWNKNTAVVNTAKEYDSVV